MEFFHVYRSKPYYCFNFDFRSAVYTSATEVESKTLHLTASTNTHQDLNQFGVAALIELRRITVFLIDCDSSHNGQTIYS